MIAPLQLVAAAGRPPARAAALVGDDDRRRIEREVRELLRPSPGLDPRLAAAVAETVDNPGSLWRAQLAWAVARAHGAADAVALALAAAIESFHTASLLFDDLPAMDDSVERRGRPCVHRRHGEAAAILAALAFVHRGYARLWEAFESAPAAARRRAAALVEECLGLAGILDGQARDVHFEPRRGTPADVLAIAAGKTVTLLRLALVLPAVLGGGSPATLARLTRLAESWGLAYQLLDDLADPADGAGDDARQGRPNFALAAGRAAAQRQLGELLARAEAASAELCRELPELELPFSRLAARFARGAQPPLPRLVAG